MPHSDAYFHSVAAIVGGAALSGDAVGRAAQPMGRGWSLWQRCNAGVDLIWVDDMEGRPRALTPKQYMVLVAALEMIDGVGETMRDLAKRLGVAPSTVSRALTKLQAWGIIAYHVGRGRLSGLVIFRRVKDDHFGYLRDAARARVQRWKKAAEARVSRLWGNVAPYILDGESGVSTTTRDTYYYRISMDATLTAQRPDREWTVDELREAGVI